MVIVIDIKIIRVVLDRLFEILNYFLKITFIHMNAILDQTVLRWLNGVIFTTLQRTRNSVRKKKDEWN